MLGSRASGRAYEPARGIRRRALCLALVWSLSYAPLADELLAAGPPPAPGMSASTLPAPPEPGAIDPVLLKKLAKLGDLTLKNTTLPDAISSISASWKINIVIGDDVQGQVSGVFQETPLYEILNSILLTNGYSYRPVGQTLVVMKIKDLGDNNPLFETTTIPIANSKPEDILNGVKILASPQGKLQVVASSHCLLVTDFPDHVARIRDFAQRLDAAASVDGGPGGGAEGGGRMQTINFRPQFVEAKFLKDPVAAMLSKEGKVAVMELDNRVVIYDNPSQLKQVQQALKQLDVPRTQVRITAYIYDLNLQDVTACGVNWNNAFKGRHDSAGAAQTSATIDTVTAAAAAAGASDGALTFMNLSHNVDLTAVVHLLQTCQNSRLLADPSVSVYDGEAATFSSVTEIPYQQLTQTAQGGNIGTTSFREAGVKLLVTPRIAEDGTIKMDCNPIFSRLTGYTPDAAAQPIIDRREAKTMVRVANGQTFVIGGLRSRTDIRSNTGVPGFMNLPWIGWLFRSKASTVTESELLVFIKPEIITVDYKGRPREVAAADTTKCGLDYVPQAQGCNGCCGEPTLPIGRFGEAIHSPVGVEYGEEVPAGSTMAPTPALDSVKMPKPATTEAVTPEAAKPATGPLLRQPDGYVSKQPDPTIRYQPPVFAQSSEGYAPSYQPPTAPPAAPSAAPAFRPAPASSQVAVRGAGFESLPAFERTVPRAGETNSPRTPTADVEHTATQTPTRHFENPPGQVATAANRDDISKNDDKTFKDRNLFSAASIFRSKEPVGTAEPTATRVNLADFAAKDNRLAPVVQAAPTSQIAVRGSGIEPLPAFGQTPPRADQTNPAGTPGGDIERTASRPAASRFENLPALDGSNSRGIFR